MESGDCGLEPVGLKRDGYAVEGIEAVDGIIGGAHALLLRLYCLLQLAEGGVAFLEGLEKSVMVGGGGDH